MKTTNEQLFRDSDIQPSSELIAMALGDANDAYTKFVSELVSREIRLEWQYYNDGKAWLAKGLYHWTGVRGGQKQITVFWLSIWEGYFKVTIYIPEKSRANVLSLPIENAVKLMTADSKQMGKLKFFPIVFDIGTVEQFEAIFTLIGMKLK